MGSHHLSESNEFDIHSQSYQFTFLLLLQHYSRGNSFFRNIRPLNHLQILYLVELLEVMRIYPHNFNSRDIIYMTQGKFSTKLTEQQIKNVKNWRIPEGETINFEDCPLGSQCNKAKIALYKLGTYSPLVPSIAQYDYTLFLGGSIQQMQWRLIGLISFLYENKDLQFHMGELHALTCDRSIPYDSKEIDKNTTILNIRRDNEHVLVETKSGVFKDLTETTAFKGLLFILKKICYSPAYYQTIQHTPQGYHPSHPVSFLDKDSFESSFYQKNKNSFILNSNFRDAACYFIKKTNKLKKIKVFETKQQRTGIESVIRPTTKLTAKNWLAKNRSLACYEKQLCKFLAVSNAPHALYQYSAVLQALEEHTPPSADAISELSILAPGASPEIPLGYPLDDLTRLIYLEYNHPEK